MLWCRPVRACAGGFAAWSDMQSRSLTFVVGIEFMEVEVQGIRHLFYADLASIDPAPGLERFLTTRNTTEQLNDPFGSVSSRQQQERLTLYDLPGVATFLIKGSRLDLPRGFRTERKTRPLNP